MTKPDWQDWAAAAAGVVLFMLLALTALVLQ